MAGKITMNDKNGYEFSVLGIRVQLIILMFPLSSQKCPNHTWTSRQVLGNKCSINSGQVVFDQRLELKIHGKD